MTAENTLNNILSEQARITPKNIALVYNNIILTYAELEEKSNQLAHYLKHLGAKEDGIIGICLDNSIDMVLAIISIIKSGSAYVPIDPTSPKDRINYIIEDTKMLFLITDRDLKLNNALKTINLTNEIGIDTFPITLPETKLKPSNLAYLIYTSGSTGLPKGVMIEHRNIINYLSYSTEIYIHSNKASSGTYFYMTYTFDAAITALFLPLILGRKIVISSKYGIDAFQDPALIENAPYDFLKITPAHLSFLNIKYGDSKFLTDNLIIGGEELKPESILSVAENKNLIIYNEYGPTECTIGCTFFSFKANSYPEGKIPIGKPFKNCNIYILDESEQLQVNGEIGELHIGGEQVARGYVNRTELTHLKFITNPFNPEERLYKTGDICKWLPDGNLEYLGRIDDQVKINGYRIELGEIETNLSLYEGIEQSVVLAKKSSFGEKRLVAYLKTNTKPDQQQIIKFLQKKLPDYMVPKVFIKIDKIPLTTNGKVDRKALNKIKINRPDLASIYKRPKNQTEENIFTIWYELLEIEKIGVNDNFFELGGNSLLAQRSIAALKHKYNYSLDITKLYKYPTIANLANFIDKTYASNTIKNKLNNSLLSMDIAVIGMAGRFPGANTIDDLWDLITNKKETTTFFNELDDSIPDIEKNDPAYVKARGIIENATQFDPAFFGLNPKIAELMDPQQRIFLEISWEVLEKTGHLPSKYPHKIGVYGGAGTNTYFENNVLSHPNLINNVGKMQVYSVNEKDYLASRTSYHLNLTGPAVSINSACSTSLLAISEAVLSLRTGQCDAAIAGGSSIMSPINSGHIYQEGSMLSENGHCTPFDNNATGTVFSDGAGAVLLKRLDDAKQDGDTIYAVIKGVGVNNDGSGKGSFTAPSSEGQTDAIKKAIENAGIEASSISYIEAHGTGTPIGDPIEFEGLVDAFNIRDKKQFCGIGSIKSNFGHLTQAAGVAGFIKTCLALYYKKLPPSLGFDTPNKNIDFLNSPFYVNTEYKEWESNDKRIAGVSSFGVGGTNVHVILEEYQNEVKKTDSPKPTTLITWSANSEVSIKLYGEALINYLNSDKQLEIADVGYSLIKSRDDFKFRKFVVSDSRDELIEVLKKSVTENTTLLKESPGEIVFTFPGQGAQYLNMGKDLYKELPVYKNAIDECAEILKKYIGEDIRNIIFPNNLTEEANEKLKDTRWTQPALFATEYATAKVWLSFGIEPTLFVGHSIGEYVAAHLSGIFSLEDGLKLIASRGFLISKLPNGSMLSVRENLESINSLIGGDLSIAAVNSQKLVVVAGPKDQIMNFSQLLDEKEIPNKQLFTSHAFHSSMMDPVLEDFKKVVLQVSFSKPLIPIVSTVTGQILKDSEALDPDYWTSHLRKPVLFSSAIENVLTYSNPLFLEIGPGAVTSTLIKQIALNSSININSLISFNINQNEYSSLLKSLGQLWVCGAEPNLINLYADSNRLFLNLPSYQFDRKKCWVDIKKQNHIISEEMINDEYSANLITKIDTQIMRKNNLTSKVKQVLENAAGIEMNDIQTNQNFIEIGLDSLLLTQVAISLKKEFGLPITFRKLNEEYPSIDTLVEYLDKNTPADLVTETTSQLNGNQASYSNTSTHATTTNKFQTAQSNFTAVGDSALDLIAQQLEILSKQVILMQGSNPMQIQMPSISLSQIKPSSVLQHDNINKSLDTDLSQEEKAEIQKPFGATPKIERQSNELNAKQAAFLKELTERYNKKTIKSKTYTSKSRSYMADPRVVTGFRPATKELVYPIVINKSSGSNLLDLDGNEYIDVLNGFGSNMFGYQPDFIKEAMHDQIEKGYEVGPQHELASEVSKLICDFTGFDRAALCSTGSEAVLGCVRIARTVTGKSLIIAFTGSYHGIIDEVLVRGTKKLKSFPAAAGIMPEAVQNILVLDYGTDESLAIIKERANEIAAVLVEPVQSRRPEFVPIDFLKEVRKITADSGSVLIFDEVITGFRMHPGGAQALFGIKADLASYGKVVGAGIPIGVIAGKSYLMDALDGGNWNYGDDSYPEVGVTYFAGTFVRHPLALASAKASLTYMKERGPALQEELNEKGKYISDLLNTEFEKRQLPIFIANYGSLWKIKYHEEIPYSELLFVLLREKGIHILDGFPCFITEATSYEDIQKVVESFKKSLDEMTEAGFLAALNQQNKLFDPKAVVFSSDNPPLKGARLGKDNEGNPAWFIKDEVNKGKYLQVK